MHNNWKTKISVETVLGIQRWDKISGVSSNNKQTCTELNQPHLKSWTWPFVKSSLRQHFTAGKMNVSWKWLSVKYPSKAFTSPPRPIPWFVCVLNSACPSQHSPPQPSPQCWPASPEGLVLTVTAPTQRYRWTDPEAHSEKKKQTNKTGRFILTSSLWHVDPITQKICLNKGAFGYAHKAFAMVSILERRYDFCNGEVPNLQDSVQLTKHNR